jgi:peptidoglycan/LPS O-acetylase OafA/YrhL
MRQIADHRIPSLDGLRALSISLVLLGHLAGTRFFPLSREAVSFWNLGDFGVRVFFVISGFLITGLLLDEVAKAGRIRLGRFYFRRTLRIFPPYYTYLFIMFAAAAAGVVQLAPYDAAHTVTYTSNYYAERSWFVGHTWSLSVEEQFYLLWPALLILAGVRRGIWIAAGVVCLGPVVRIIEWNFVPSVAAGIGHRFETIADAIAVGCVLAGTRAYLHATPLYMSALRSPLFAIVPLAAVAGAITHDHPQIWFGVGMTLTNVCMALVIDWCVTFYDGRVGRMLNTAPLVFVGTISYSLYLWQQPFLNRASAADAATFPVNLLLAVVCAVASYYLIERPSLRVRRALEARWFSAPVPQRVPQPAQVIATLVIILAVAAPLAGCAAAHGGATIGRSDAPPEMSGTISGVVRAAGSNAALSARRVTAVNLTTGAKYESSTAANGGYTMKVPMGHYRLEVALGPDETLSAAPAEVEINRSDLDSGRDFTIAIKPIGVPWR